MLPDKNEHNAKFTTDQILYNIAYKTRVKTRSPFIIIKGTLKNTLRWQLRFLQDDLDDMEAICKKGLTPWRPCVTSMPGGWPCPPPHLRGCSDACIEALPDIDQAQLFRAERILALTSWNYLIGNFAPHEMRIPSGEKVTLQNLDGIYRGEHMVAERVYNAMSFNIMEQILGESCRKDGRPLTALNAANTKCVDIKDEVLTLLDTEMTNFKGSQDFKKIDLTKDEINSARESLAAAAASHSGDVSDPATRRAIAKNKHKKMAEGREHYNAS